MNRCIRINKKDNVAVVLYDAKPGDKISVEDMELTVLDEIPFGHKVALETLKKGAVVYKYGQPIGMCTKDIAAGSWLHIHNCESLRGGVIK